MSNISSLQGPTTPTWLQRMQLLLAPVETWSEWKRLYGNNLKIGRENPVVCLSTPQAIETVLKASPEQISSCQTSAPMKAILGSNSILFLDKKRHQQERKLLMPMFHKESILQYNQIICSTTRQAIEKLEKGRVVKIASLTNDITLSVLLQAVFGLKNGELCYLKLKKILNQISALFSNPLFSITSLLPILQQPIGIWQEFLDLRQQDDVTLCPKTNINISIFLAHWNENTFPNAEQFIPQRFLERQFSPYEFLTFGGGDRRCLGASLAWQEIKLILANIVPIINV